MRQEDKTRSASHRRDVPVAGLLRDSIVEITCFHKDPRHAEVVREIGLDCLGRERTPAWTAVGMTGFRAEEHLHSVHALAVV